MTVIPRISLLPNWNEDFKSRTRSIALIAQLKKKRKGGKRGGEGFISTLHCSSSGFFASTATAGANSRLLSALTYLGRQVFFIYRALVLVLYHHLEIPNPNPSRSAPMTGRKIMSVVSRSKVG